MKLGDAVHYVAQPVAKTIDLVFKTNLQHCSACAKRREFLNNIMSINNIPVHSTSQNLKTIGTNMEKVQEVIDEENKKKEEEEKSKTT